MRKSQRYPFTTFDPSLGEAGFRPYLPITLTHRGQSVEATGLLDTGATVNVLPYHLGLELGAIWEELTTSLQLTGNLAQFEARVLVLSAKVAGFEPVRLVFAWTQADNVPLILGQVNFFIEFDACFYRSQLFFEVCAKNAA
jgi:predicted aspartyl protease